MDMPGPDVNHRNPFGCAYTGTRGGCSTALLCKDPQNGRLVDTERLIGGADPKGCFAFLRGITLWDGPCLTSSREDGFEQLLRLLHPTEQPVAGGKDLHGQRGLVLSDSRIRWV